ncbi:DNA-binding transcriptional MerR regulator [Stackebrandtia albiflava]|uniref:DNA-binding transcriptional MerR regulator n=1 Tax=Stackebrandtia albiflava TaxID=406432 RepID=A0A562VDI9_9ACTN|nr:MerR family transcriptional regulator [Stackebrandtia albiflava]TWJ15949.1 DNA-binding transcriptional MerR regulator [Stackebrandtia albiflava]
MTVLTGSPPRHGIGEAARRSGFSMDTLRYYEKIGLLVDIARTSTGQRCFSDADLGWLRMLRCLRDTGMPVAEMQRFTQLCRAGDHTVPERVALLERHNARVEEHLRDLREKQAGIAAKIAHYRGLSA